MGLIAPSLTCLWVFFFLHEQKHPSPSSPSSNLNPHHLMCCSHHQTSKSTLVDSRQSCTDRKKTNTSEKKKSDLRLPSAWEAQTACRRLCLTDAKHQRSRRRAHPPWLSDQHWQKRRLLYQGALVLRRGHLEWDPADYLFLFSWSWWRVSAASPPGFNLLRNHFACFGLFICTHGKRLFINIWAQIWVQINLLSLMILYRCFYESADN